MLAAEMSLQTLSRIWCGDWMVPVSRVLSSSCCRLLQCLLKPSVTVQAALLLWGLTSRGGWAASFACFLLLEVSSDASPCLLVENLLLPIIMKESIQHLLEVLINWCYQEFPLSEEIQGASPAPSFFGFQQLCKHQLLQNCFQPQAQGSSSGCVPEPQSTQKTSQKNLSLLSSKGLISCQLTGL